MIENVKTRLWIVAIVLVVTAIWCVPNFVNVENMWWPTQSKMVMGLDIQGGAHLVYRVDVDSAVKQDVTRLATTLKTDLQTEKIETKEITVKDAVNGIMQIDMMQPTDEQPIRTYLDRMFAGSMRVDSVQDGKMAVSYSELYLKNFRKRLLEQAIETIRNRIDEFGVAEPSITAQGSDRILVQLPGIKDAGHAKELINRTAKLEFMILQSKFEGDLQKLIDEAEKEGNFKFEGMKYSEYVDKLNTALKGKIPENSVVYFEKDEAAVSMEAGRRPYLLSTVEAVPGDRLTDASVGQGQFGEPIVHFRFDPVGARQFGDMTKKHTGELMAIVLDRVVKSAPNIREPITGGSGQITMGTAGRDPQATFKEAQLVAMSLRAGALPASLEQLEERSVGPSLGADAIAKGQLATLISALAVFIAISIYYRTFGLITCLALSFNIGMTLAILSALGATLTLPGIAGLALTIGIAVDSNVIIYERIKEELAKGASLIAAIREGYDRAMSSIFDANLTSILVAVVLIYYGTGPVRGFAVTLIAGLLTSLFCSVFFTKVLFDLMVGRWKWNLAIK